jgi:hypothetical protein
MYDNMIAACSLEHVGDEFRGDRCAGFILLVLSGIRETRYDGSDSSGGCCATGINHDEKFHEVVVYTVCPRLDDEDVFIPDRLA